MDNMMEYKKTISSDLTFCDKYIFSSLIIGAMAFLAMYFLINDPDKCWFPFFSLIFGGIFFYIYIIPLKRIQLQDKNLIISNYFKTVAIPISEIEKITENRLASHHPVCIHLKQKTIFGKKIIFMPQSRFTLNLFGSHPVVGELRKLVVLCKKSSDD